MINGVKIASPAKINLHLEVLNKRKDGFHNLVSIFTMVSLCDLIEVSKHGETGQTVIRGIEEIRREEDLVFKAAALFRSYSGAAEGITIEINKQIPLAAGLGGGSSNAASTLIALNLLFETGFSEDELAHLAARLGSDVPFFCNGPSAVVTGRGEIVRPIPSRKDLCIVLVNPGIRISTAEAFVWWDAENHARSEAGISVVSMSRRYEKLSPGKWEFFNSFQSILEKKFPVIDRIIRSLLAHGACYASVSGSGSSVFGVFKSRRNAERALKKVNAGDSWIVNTLDRKPSAVLQ